MTTPYKRLVCAAGVLLSSIGCATIARAQAAQTSAATVLLSGVVPIPVGPLVNNRGSTPGANLGFRLVPSPGAPLAIRLDVYGLPSSAYDNSRPNYTLSVANGGSAVFGMVGPEVDIPARLGHYFVTATAGAARIWSSSAATNGTNPGFGPWSTTTDRSATNFAWGIGGGFVTPRFHRGGLAGEVGLRYFDLGRSTYVTTFPALTNGPLHTTGYTTTGRHETTMIAPSIGVIWSP